MFHVWVHISHQFWPSAAFSSTSSSFACQFCVLVQVVVLIIVRVLIVVLILVVAIILVDINCGMYSLELIFYSEVLADSDYLSLSRYLIFLVFTNRHLSDI